MKNITKKIIVTLMTMLMVFNISIGTASGMGVVMAASETYSFEYEVIGKTNTVSVIGFNYTDEFDGTVEIPAEIDGMQVVEIGDYAFYDCSELISVIIPYGVTSIQSGAFAGCDSLENIEIPNSVTYIWDNVFNSCSSLKSIEIPASVMLIASQAFMFCSSLTNIEVSEQNTQYSRWCSV